MTQKSEYLVNLIFKKLKNYKAKEISLEKENLKKFIFSLYRWLNSNQQIIKTVMIKNVF